MAQMPCLLCCERTRPGSGAVRHPGGVIVTNESFPSAMGEAHASAKLWCLGKATSLKCRQSWILSPRRRVRPDHSFCRKGEGMRGQRVGTEGVRSGIEVVNWPLVRLQVLFALPQRWQQDLGSLRLGLALSLRTDVTDSGYTAICNKQV